MKDKLKWLLKQPDNKNLPKPIFIVGLIIVLLIAIIWKFLLIPNRTEISDTPQQTEQEQLIDGEKSGMITSMKNIFKSLLPEKEEFVETPLSAIPNIPDLSFLDNLNMVEKVDSIFGQKFDLEEIKLEQIGRKDPLKPLDGPNVGTYDTSRTLNGKGYEDNESSNYFGGMGVENIFFNTMYKDDNGILRGDFITLGGLFKGLKEGDYINQFYYIKEFNTKEEYVILKYKNNEFKLFVKNLVNINGSKETNYEK